MIGAPPLLEIGGGTANLVASSSLLSRRTSTSTTAPATEIGSIVGNEDVTEPAGPDQHGVHRRRLSLGSVQMRICRQRDRSTTCFNLGGGIENIYTAIPGLDGAADTVTDTLVTPFGQPQPGLAGRRHRRPSALDPGDAFTAGLDLDLGRIRSGGRRGHRDRPAGVPRPVRPTSTNQTSQVLRGLGCLAFRLSCCARAVAPLLLRRCGAAAKHAAKTGLKMSSRSRVSFDDLIRHCPSTFS